MLFKSALRCYWHVSCVYMMEICIWNTTQNLWVPLVLLTSQTECRYLCWCGEQCMTPLTKISQKKWPMKSGITYYQNENVSWKTLFFSSFAYRKFTSTATGKLWSVAQYVACTHSYTVDNRLFVRKIKTACMDVYAVKGLAPVYSTLDYIVMTALTQN